MYEIHWILYFIMVLQYKFICRLGRMKRLMMNMIMTMTFSYLHRYETNSLNIGMNRQWQ